MDVEAGSTVGLGGQRLGLACTLKQMRARENWVLEKQKLFDEHPSSRPNIAAAAALKTTLM
jgi:lysine/ornithine N-monooxygenase